MGPRHTRSRRGQREAPRHLVVPRGEGLAIRGYRLPREGRALGRPTWSAAKDAMPGGWSGEDEITYPGPDLAGHLTAARGRPDTSGRHGRRRSANRTNGPAGAEPFVGRSRAGRSARRLRDVPEVAQPTEGRRDSRTPSFVRTEDYARSIRQRGWKLAYVRLRTRTPRATRCLVPGGPRMARQVGKEAGDRIPARCHRLVRGRDRGTVAGRRPACRPTSRPRSSSPSTWIRGGRAISARSWPATRPCRSGSSRTPTALEDGVIFVVPSNRLVEVTTGCACGRPGPAASRRRSTFCSRRPRPRTARASPR